MIKHRCLCDRIMEFLLPHGFYGIMQFIIILDLLLSLITVTDTREHAAHLLPGLSCEHGMEQQDGYCENRAPCCRDDIFPDVIQPVMQLCYRLIKSILAVCRAEILYAGLLLQLTEKGILLIILQQMQKTILPVRKEREVKVDCIRIICLQFFKGAALFCVWASV